MRNPVFVYYGKILLFLFILYNGRPVYSQITSGKILYERKTNLFKKFKDDNMRDWLKEENKTKVDVFELCFNDSLSAFRPQESDLKDKMGWATSRNTVYQDFNKHKRFTIKTIWGEEIQVSDSLFSRRWKITDSRRTICGYPCRKAIWQVNDSTRIYAWYCNELAVSTGPESFYGLPGAILGLATEDGGVIYFAKSVEVRKCSMEELVPKKIRGKVYSSVELRGKLEKEFGKEKWGKAMIREVFDVW